MAARIADFLDRAAQSTVLVVGDVMVDAYLWGRVERISPEAPVPVVQVTQRSARLGGAANVALNAQALGARAIVLTVTGDDDAAHTLARLFAEHGLPGEGLLRSPLRRTTVKTRVISGHQHIVRVDEEQEDELASADEERLLDHVRSTMATDRPAVVVLEDYDKGVLTERVIAGVVAAAHALGIPVAVDPKKKNFFAYRGVDLFKPNLKELREGLKTDVDPADAQSVRRAVQALEDRLGNTASLITLSEHGMHMHSGGEEHRIAAHRRTIADVSGAGDTVIAVAALALAQALPLKAIAQLANLAGGLVCEEVGVVPLNKERFRAEAERLDLPE
jgi:D-glycero-beta-D-manno-heptose-7-phosphate kinase